MNLRDLVGKTAIRTAKSDVVFPWELPQSLFVQVKPYGTSCHSDKEKYMNHPVKNYRSKRRTGCHRRAWRKKALGKKIH